MQLTSHDAHQINFVVNKITLYVQQITRTQTYLNVFNELIEFTEWFHKCKIERHNKTVETIKGHNCCQFLFTNNAIHDIAHTNVHSVVTKLLISSATV